VSASRAIVDRISEFTLRPFIIKGLSRGALKEKKHREINDEYRGLISKVLVSGDGEFKAEVIKRRERGRIIRSVFIPCMLLAYILFSRYSWYCLGASLVVVSFSLLFIYSYAEGAIYEECLLFAKNAEQDAETVL